MKKEYPMVSAKNKLLQKQQKTGRGRKSYSYAEKIAALKIYELNNSLNKTHLLTGISRITLDKWTRDSRLLCDSRVNTKKIEKIVNDRIEKGEADILTKVYDVKIKALHKMAGLIEISTSLRDVTAAFAVLSGVTIGNHDIDNAKGAQFVQNIKQSIQQRIFMINQNTDNHVPQQDYFKSNSKEQEAPGF